MIAKRLRAMVDEARRAAVSAGSLTSSAEVDFVLERPRLKEHGDWATNLAMQLQSAEQRPPREIAAALVAHLLDPDGILDRVEIAGPGFINFTLSGSCIREELLRLAEAGEDYGRWDLGAGRRVMLEFVSANPVGPMHVGHGRWAALGDVLANLLSFTGYAVSREFYVNDYGRQMDLFARSVEAAYLEILGEPSGWPEDGYRGAYIYDIARELVGAYGERYREADPAERREVFGGLAYRQVLAHLEHTLEEFGVHFDTWFSERELHESGAVRAVIAQLQEAGLAYQSEGAVWMASSRFGDDKDRVLVRGNEEPTYFASDIAYHRNKMERGFDHLIDIWGADHHGYVKRMLAAMEAIGYPGCLEIIIGQLVNLKSGGQPVRMSKRSGEMVTFEELVEDVGADAARFFFLLRGQDSAVDFDIELAKEQSQNNPVYYVQYAHARISSILRYADEQGVPVDEAPPELSSLRLIREEEELDLARKLFEFEELVRDAALDRAPHRLTHYAQEMAAAFHFFYTKHRVITSDAELTRARLFLVLCSRQVLRNCLKLLGISAPESM